MLLSEMFNSYSPEYQDQADDNSVLRGLQDQRKTRLTLSRINRIRKMHDMREYEKEKELEQVKLQYGSSATDASESPF